MNRIELEEREQEALNSLEDAKERIRQLEEDLRDMTKLAVDYKEANTRLEDELREFHAKDGGRTREHNLLVQENRKLRDVLKAVDGWFSLMGWNVNGDHWQIIKMIQSALKSAD